MVKYSFNSTTLRNMDVLEAIRNIKAYGYSGIELSLNDNHLHPLKTDMKRINEIKDCCAEIQLPIICVAAGGDRLLSQVPYEPSLICPDLHGRLKRLDFIKQSMEIANCLGSPVININSGKLKSEISKELAYEYLYHGIEELLKEDSNLGIVIEPEPDFFIGTSTSAINLLKSINHPRFSLNLDIGHVFCCEDDPYVAIEAALPYTKHIHIEDIKNRIHHHEIPGEGDIDFSKVMHILKESGYRHYVSVELHHHADIWQRALKESIEYLRRL